MWGVAASLAADEGQGKRRGEAQTVQIDMRWGSVIARDGQGKFSTAIGIFAAAALLVPTELLAAGTPPKGTSRVIGKGTPAAGGEAGSAERRACEADLISKIWINKESWKIGSWEPLYKAEIRLKPRAQENIFSLMAPGKHVEPQNLRTYRAKLVGNGLTGPQSSFHICFFEHTGGGTRFIKSCLLNGTSLPNCDLNFLR